MTCAAAVNQVLHRSSPPTIRTDRQQPRLLSPDLQAHQRSQGRLPALDLVQATRRCKLSGAIRDWCSGGLGSVRTRSRPSSVSVSTFILSYLHANMRIGDSLVTVQAVTLTSLLAKESKILTDIERQQFVAQIRQLVPSAKEAQQKIARFIVLLADQAGGDLRQVEALIPLVSCRVTSNQ